MRKLLLFSSLLAIAATLPQAPAHAIVMGCTGMGGWADAPFGNFDVDNTGMLGRNSDIKEVPANAVLYSPAPVVFTSTSGGGYDVATKTFSGGWVKSQRGMILNALSCQSIYDPKFDQQWADGCASTTLTLTCITDADNPGCEGGALAKHIAQNPLTPMQKPYWSFIQTCVPPQSPTPVSAEDTNTNIGVTVNRPSLPVYERNGTALNPRWDDFTVSR